MRRDVVVENLDVVYTIEGRKIEALRKISFTIADGDFACLVGPSGCGKTTFLNVLGGFVRPTGGIVTIGGKPVQDMTVRKGYVFQEYALFPWLTVAQNVEFALQARNVPRKELRAEAVKSLEMVGLDKYADLFPHRLSGGMKQRVAVARALAYDPPLLLFDEPFGALDAFTRERLQKLVQELHQKTGKTFIYITHNVSEAVFLAERVLVLTARPGQIKEDMRITLPHPREEHSEEFTTLVQRIRKLVEA